MSSHNSLKWVIVQGTFESALQGKTDAYLVGKKHFNVELLLQWPHIWQMQTQAIYLPMSCIKLEFT